MGTEFQHKKRRGRRLQIDGMYHSVLSRDDMTNVVHCTRLNEPFYELTSCSVKKQLL